jgi:hypothetical protein
MANLLRRCQRWIRIRCDRETPTARSHLQRFVYPAREAKHLERRVTAIYALKHRHQMKSTRSDMYAAARRGANTIRPARGAPTNTRPESVTATPKAHPPKRATILASCGSVTPPQRR